MRTSDGWDDNPAGFLWENWLTRAINGKRGQAALRDLEEALLALPEPRLIEGDLIDHAGEVCALGALALYKTNGLPRLRANMRLYKAREEYYTAEASGSALFGQKELGLARTIAWTIAEENDINGRHETPEQRFRRILAWVRSLLQPMETA